MDLKIGLTTRAILKKSFRDPFTGNSFPCGAILDVIEIEPTDFEHPIATAICAWGNLKQRIPLELLDEI